MADIEDDARRLLERMKLVPPREPGENLRAADELKILELAKLGRTQQQIAAEIGCHQSTVSRTLAEYDDTRLLARKYFEAKAIEMTRRLVTDAKPETVLRVLAKLDVVRDDGVAADTEPETAIFIGIGMQMNVVQVDGTRRSPSELFEAHDVIQ